MDRRTPFRDGPEDCSETTTEQHIIYNTHRARARISSPLATAREQRPHRAPNRNVTYVVRDAPKAHPRAIFQNKQENHSPTKRNTVACPRNGPGLPPTGPSPGANPLIYPSSLPLASGNPLSGISPKSHGFFFFFSNSSFRLQQD